ncbi:MAG: AAA family ATPase [Myxococcota bacterium]
MDWAFGDCVLSEDLFALRRAGRVVKLEPKVFHVFCFLVANRERVVSKAEILDHVWPGEAISESVLPRSVAVIRRAVGDTRAEQRVVETIHGHGYRFVASVEEPVGEAKPVEAAKRSSDEGERNDFVGRKRSLGRLAYAFDETLAGRGRIALLVGQPGIGKTRTLEEQLARVGGRAAIHVGGCFEGNGAPVYWPFVQVLRSLIRGMDDEQMAGVIRGTDADLIPLVPELRDRMPLVGASEPLEGEQARFRLFDSVASFLRRAAELQPLVVVLEDLHWADRDSLHLVGFLAGALRDSSVCLFGTCRDLDSDPDHPLAALMRDLRRSSHFEEILLAGLPEEDIVQLLHQTVGEEVADSVSAWVVEMTEGNPFFVRELAMLVADGSASAFGKSRELGSELPRGIREAVELRLESISPACRDVLRLGAVVGRDFKGRVLAEVTGETPELQLELLGEALASGVLREAETVGSYSFSHALVRQTLYDELRLPQRIQAHRETAAALERIFGDAAVEHVSELAFHLFESAAGGDALRSVEVSMQAAALAHQQCAYEESVRHLERALEALDLAEEPEPLRRCELLLAEAEARWDAGQRDRSHVQFRRAAEIARELDRPELLARAAVGMRSYGDNTRPDAEAVRLLEEALEAVDSEFPVWRARILSRLTYCEPYCAEMGQRRGLSEEAATLTAESEDPAALFDVFVGRYWAALGPDGLDQRQVVGREAAEAGRRLKDPRLIMLGHDTLVGAHLMLGEFDSVKRHVSAFEKDAEALRQPFFRFHGLMLKITYAMNCGRFDEAETWLAEAAQVGRGSVEDSEALSDGISFWLRDMRGEATNPAEAEGILKGVANQLLSSSSGTDQIMKASIVKVLVAVGQYDEARKQLHQIFDDGIEDLSRNENWLMTISLASSAAIALDEPTMAERLFSLLLPYEALMFVHDHLHIVRGSVASALGALAGASGRHDEAVDRLQAAIQHEEAIGAAPSALDARILLIQQYERMGRTDSVATELSRAKRVAECFGSRRLFRVFPSLGE